MNFIAWTPIFMAVAILSLFCLWHVSTTEPRFIPRWGWVLLVIFTAPIGGLIYVLVEIFDAGVTRTDAEGRQPQQE
jgi:hypothetical protein